MIEIYISVSAEKRFRTVLDRQSVLSYILGVDFYLINNPRINFSKNLQSTKFNFYISTNFLSSETDESG